MSLTCPHCSSSHVQAKGSFQQKYSRRLIQRFSCKSCDRGFSESTFLITYKQQKPQLNRPLFLNLCSGVSLRRSAKNLGLSYQTVYRRFLWMSELAKKKHEEFLLSLTSCPEIQIDEMESIEHTKLKPLTIPLVITKNQLILGIGCGQIPAKGITALLARRKYGPRPSVSSELLKSILDKIVAEPLVVKSDGKSAYRALIKGRWPKASHEIYSRRVEKRREEVYLNTNKKRFDPLFALNQRCAKLRADINRLIRRSWSTTKKAENLAKHLVLYACYNNQIEVV